MRAARPRRRVAAVPGVSRLAPLGRRRPRRCLLAPWLARRLRAAGYRAAALRGTGSVVGMGIPGARRASLAPLARLFPLLTTLSVLKVCA